MLAENGLKRGMLLLSSLSCSHAYLASTLSLNQLPRNITTVRWQSQTAFQGLESYVADVAKTAAPKHLGALTKVFTAQGAKPLNPADRTDLHPLLVPLCEQPGSTTGAESVIGLLRWPRPSSYKGMSLPVVSMKRGGRNMTLVARTVDECLHRILVEEEAALAAAAAAQGSTVSSGASRPLAAAAGEAAASQFRPPSLDISAFKGGAHMYLIRKVGMFPDVCEARATAHEAKGDRTSALVTAEWYMRSNFFPSWGRPYEFAAELLARSGREEEARDMARIALRLPWWSLRASFDEVAALAGLAGHGPEKVKFMLSEEAAASQQPGLAKQAGSMQQPKTKQQLAMERAVALMDMVAAGALPSYGAIRTDLEAAFKEAGLGDVANFVAAGK